MDKQQYYSIIPNCYGHLTDLRVKRVIICKYQQHLKLDTFIPKLRNPVYLNNKFPGNVRLLSIKSTKNKQLIYFKKTA